MRRTLVVVCGLAAEAAIARGDGQEGDGIEVLAGGGDQHRLSADLAAIGQRARGMISFGVAGGLAPGLVPGDVHIAAAVIAPDGTRYPADAAWTAALNRALGLSPTIFAAVDAPLADATDKAALHARTGAATVDMESHIAARAAADHGCPFAALRVVTDPAERSLPHAATVGMRADGKINLAAILMSLAKNPAQLPALIRTGLDAKAAFASLLRCRQLLGPNLALLDLGETLLNVP